MNTNFKKTSLVILGVTALILSRLLFALFNDPEGPNLLIVIVAAVVMYFASLLAYRCKVSESKKFVMAIGIQILILVAGFCLGSI